MGDLTDRFGLLHLGGSQQQPQQQQNGVEQTAGGGGSGGLGVPEGQGVRKQRSQRFTVPTSPPRTNSSSLLPTSPSTHSFSSLPYQPPPPPVQTQSIPPPALSFLADPAPAPPPQGQGQTSYYSSRAYSSSGLSNGGEPSPQPQLAYGGQQPYRPVSQADFLAPVSGAGGGSGFLPAFAGLSNGGGGGLMREASPAPPGLGMGQGKVFNEDGEEIIETAIVIKSIPFIAAKEQLLAVMDSLSLPPPFAFNFHYDQGQFRGLAFANYRLPGEAQVTVSALNGFEFMGRKLRAEFKRALKPGEKEAIERNKAIKRMRSAQLLAAVPSTAGGYSYGVAGGGGTDGLGAGPPHGGWNRREASAPGGYAGYGGGGVAPPVPQIPLHLQQQQYNGYLPQHQHQQQQQGEEEVDYGRPLLNGTFSGAFSNGLGGGGGLSPSPAPSNLSSGGGARSFQPAPSGLLPSALPLHSHSHSHNLPQQHTFVSPIPAPLPVAPAMEFSYSSSSSPPSSDVGTSVSQRMGGGGTTVGTSVSEGDAEGEGGSAVTGAGGGGKDELDLNDPLTLDLYSRILLFRDDQLRDELAFARSLTTQQRRIVHLVAKKLGLEHGSSGEGGERRAVVWKKGANPLVSGGGGGREEVRRLRQTVSSAAIRRPPSTNDLLSSSPAGARGYNASSPFASRPTTSYLSASPSSASSSAQQQQHQSSYHANLRGKKSMPDIRYSRDGHILPLPPSHSSSAYSSASASSSRSPSPAVPVPSSAGLPQSTSLAANLAAYSSGTGYAPASSSTFGTPIAAQKRRSYASLRSTAAGGGGGWESPGGLGNGSNFATVAGIPHAFSASSLTTTPTRGGSRPSVQNLFSGSPTKEKEEQGRNLFWASSSAERQSTPGKAEAVRQPVGPGVAAATGGSGNGSGSGAVGEELEWRKR